MVSGKTRHEHPILRKKLWGVQCFIVHLPRGDILRQVAVLLSAGSKRNVLGIIQAFVRTEAPPMVGLESQTDALAIFADLLPEDRFAVE